MFSLAWWRHHSLVCKRRVSGCRSTYPVLPAMVSADWKSRSRQCSNLRHRWRSRGRSAPPERQRSEESRRRRSQESRRRTSVVVVQFLQRLTPSDLSFGSRLEHSTSRMSMYRESQFDKPNCRNVFRWGSQCNFAILVDLGASQNGIRSRITRGDPTRPTFHRACTGWRCN